MWRDMKKVVETDDVIVEWTEHRIEIYKDHMVHHFCTDDSSFGEFLYLKYCEDWDTWEYNTKEWLDPYGILHSQKEIKDTMKKVFEPGLTISAEDNAKAKYALSSSAINTCNIIGVSNTTPAIEFVGLDTKADVAHVNCIEERVAALETKINNNNENKKENSIMKGFNFDFGPVNPAAVRMSMHGLAVKNKAGTYVSYDAKNDEIVDVDILNFDGAKYIWKMPVAIKDIAVGDTIVHQNVPMFVVGISEDKKALFAVDPVVGERKEIMLTRSPFGFHFATKVVNMLGGMFNGNASAENPFGNMWMLMAMSDENKDMKEMIPFMVMANGGMNNMNPMMFYCMMGKDNVDPMVMAMMMGAFNPAPAHECNCGGNCGNHN
jgi:hypothetical protein